MRAVVFDQCTQKFTLMLWWQGGVRSSAFALMQCHHFFCATHADGILTTCIGATRRMGTHRDVQHVPRLQPTRHKKRPVSCQHLTTPQSNVSMRHEDLLHCLIRRVSEARPSRVVVCFHFICGWLGWIKIDRRPVAAVCLVQVSGLARRVEPRMLHAADLQIEV